MEEPTAKQIMAELRLMRGEAMTHEMMGRAVTAGILAAVSDPDMWHSAMQAMQAVGTDSPNPNAPPKPRKLTISRGPDGKATGIEEAA